MKSINSSASLPEPAKAPRSGDPNYDALLHLHIPRWEELPQIPLYMDQVIQFLNDVLSPLSFDTGGKPVLTSSMVNNYVKTSILKKPERKQYKPYHLAFLVVVILMKRTYSLAEISSCIQIYSDIENPERISKDYNRFVSAFEDCLHEILSTGHISHAYFENPTPEQNLMINVIRTLACKVYVQWLLVAAGQPAETD